MLVYLLSRKSKEIRSRQEADQSYLPVTPAAKKKSYYEWDTLHHGLLKRGFTIIYDSGPSKTLKK